MSEETTSSTPSVESNEVNITSVPDAMRGFVKGALPPQGIEEFSKLVETTFTNVVDLYTNVFTQTFKGFQPLFDAIGELFPSEHHESCIPRKRIMINQNKEKTNGHNGHEGQPEATESTE